MHFVICKGSAVWAIIKYIKVLDISRILSNALLGTFYQAPPCRTLYRLPPVETYLHIQVIFCVIIFSFAPLCTCLHHSNISHIYTFIQVLYFLCIKALLDKITNLRNEHL